MTMSKYVGFLALLVVSAEALKCKTCRYAEITKKSENPLFNAVMEEMAKKTQQECLSDLNSVSSEECGELPEGRDEWRCVSGAVDLSVALATNGSERQPADLKTVARACLPINSNSDNEKYSEGCHPASMYEEEIKAKMSAGAEQKLRLVVDDISGQVCICNRDDCNTGALAAATTAAPGDAVSMKPQPVLQLLLLVVTCLALIFSMK